MRINDMILYRQPGHRELVEDLVALMNGDKVKDPSGAAAGLVDFAVTHGFRGNLMHSLLAYVIATNENAFSTSCEIRGKVTGTINQLALHDFRIFKEWFDYDLAKLDESTGCGIFGFLKDYERTENDNSVVFNTRIRNNIQDLAGDLAQAADENEWMDIVCEFYRHFGVGKFGLHKAFRIEERNEKVKIAPIKNIEHVNLDDLIGYESQKAKLLENTEAFVEGRPANNCLLYGDAGTGKSSSIKALLHKYYDQGLRMIEIYKHQFKDLSEVIAQVKSRNYKFIIFMDDLSFEDFEIEYKYLKAIIEGGLEVRPQNVLIYATSNRRHLIKETWADRSDVVNDNGIYKSDTIQEKTSLASRFGCSIYFGKPEPMMFRKMVKILAERAGLDIPYNDLLLEANRWELSHGGISGRAAQQFITYLLSKKDEDDLY